jgi:tetratricopeptide (TPR) repeat protein
MNMEEFPAESSDEELWEFADNGSGADRTDALIELAQRAYRESKYREAASLQERLATVLIEDSKYDEALVAFARAINAWQEAEEWDRIEEVAEHAHQLEAKAFDAEPWRDFYAAYAWSAHTRRSTAMALEYVDRALKFAEARGSLYHQALHLWQKACMISSLGRPSKALSILETALELARESDTLNLHLIADILAEMAQSHVEMRNSERALALATEAYELLEETWPWIQVRHRVLFALGCAEDLDGDYEMASVRFQEVIADAPAYTKIRALIKMSEVDLEEPEKWEKRAYTLARNTNAMDLLAHLETNRAMKADPAVAIPVLSTIIENAIASDDDDTRDRARLVLARKYLDIEDFASALRTIDTLSVTNFGDNLRLVLTFLVLRADALIGTKQFVEAGAIATSLTKLDPKWDNAQAIAEGYWQLAQIELDSNGPTLEWERLANFSVASSASASDFRLALLRTESLHNSQPNYYGVYRERIETVDELIKDIERDFGETEN